MDKILITGGTGFVGFWLRKAQPKNYACFYISRNDYNGNLNTNWHSIIHLAPISPTRILELAKVYNSRVLFASSGIVYHPENNTEYRQNKIKWEKECIDSGVDVVIARLFAFFGYKLDKFKAITAFEEKARKGEQLVISGDGNTVRSYQHGLEMAKWMWAILDHGISGEAYDVGSDEPKRMIDLAMEIVAREKSKSSILIENGVDPMPYYLPEDTAKTKRLLNL